MFIGLDFASIALGSLILKHDSFTQSNPILRSYHFTNTETGGGFLRRSIQRRKALGC
jgi:hypothetical protein